MLSTSKFCLLAHVGLCLVLRAAVRADALDGNGGSPALKMEPFFVIGSQGDWRYTQIPDYEILSELPDPATRDFLQGLNDGQRLLDFIVPRQFQARFDVPKILILCDRKVISPLYGEILNPSSRQAQHSPIEYGNQNSENAFPNLETCDTDRISTLVINNGDSLSGRVSLMAIAHVRLLLDRRIPRLPEWLKTGIMGLYVDLYAAAKSAPGSIQQGTDFVYHIRPFAWAAPGNSGKDGTGDDLFGDDSADSTRLMGQLLEREAPNDAKDRELWNARAKLFARWALDTEAHRYRNSLLGDLASAVGGLDSGRSAVDGTNSPHLKAFWNFAALASAGPVTESSFRGCFGLSYSEAAKQLSAYLPHAVQDPIDLRLLRSASEADPVLRDASGTEVIRLRGEWERLACRVVRSDYSEFASAKVRHEFMTALEAGVRDPRLLALVGLLDCDNGNDAEAAGFLEAAVQANVAGPRVYYELARIRFNTLGPDESSRLSSAEVNHILEPLVAGAPQSPQMLESYELAAKVLKVADGVTSRQLEYLNSVRQFFPRELDVLYDAARLNAANGDESEASLLAGVGEQLSMTPQDRDRFSTVGAHPTQQQ